MEHFYNGFILALFHSKIFHSNFFPFVAPSADWKNVTRYHGNACYAIRQNEESFQTPQA